MCAVMDVVTVHNSQIESEMSLKRKKQEDAKTSKRHAYAMCRLVRIDHLIDP